MSDDQLFLISIHGHLLGNEWAISEQEALEQAAQDYVENPENLEVRLGRWPVQQEEEDESSGRRARR